MPVNKHRIFCPIAAMEVMTTDHLTTVKDAAINITCENIGIILNILRFSDLPESCFIDHDFPYNLNRIIVQLHCISQFFPLLDP